MDLNNVLEETIAVGREVGAFIRKERQVFDLRRVEIKGLNDMVSYVDKVAEQMIVDRLMKLLPEAGYITEEGTNTTKGEVYNWIIDPLDGTTNFIHDLPFYCVSIGLQKNEEIVLGVVYDVTRSECFYAIKDGGAYCNETPLRVSGAPALSSSLIATGFPYDSLGQTDAFGEVLKSLTENSHGFRRLGSAALDLCYVASGRVDGYFQHNLKPYDVAAGIIIVQEAGGKVSDFIGGNNFIFGGEMVATNNVIHEELLQEVKPLTGSAN
ncbi:MAG TPA: inositol monophosphatase family protein [Cyclobacteriaceae bacterium]|nr:inositol monophosphatase family protein [Cyclobacteriaceae bacterium]